MSPDQCLLPIFGELALKLEIAHWLFKNMLVKRFEGQHAFFRNRKEIFIFKLFLVFRESRKLGLLCEDSKHLSNEILVTNVEEALELFIHELVSIIELPLLDLGVEDVV